MAKQPRFAVPEDVLDDLGSRFIINMPVEERNDMVKVMFQVELAHWFYLDLIVEDNPSLPRVPFAPFSQIIFAHVPFLRKSLSCLDGIIDSFRAFKANVPTFGAILLDPTLRKCLMVQGYYASKTWGFPKGKVNHGEDPMDCAIREVKEETGYDCSHLISSEDFIEKKVHGTMVRLYIIAGVDAKEKFAPQTRCEIRGIEWFEIKELPAKGQNRGHFFMAEPFIRELKDWIKRRNKFLGGRSRGAFDLNSLLAGGITQIAVVREGPRIVPTPHWENFRLDWPAIWSQVEQEQI